MNYKKTTAIVVVLICIFAVMLFWRLEGEDPGNFNPPIGQGEEIKNFEDCINAGFPSMESWPRQCRDNSDNTFVEIIADIILDYPKAGQKITSPIQISGSARGSWFFEGDFPVVLTNWDGLIIAETFATAQGEWMTEDFVPFTATIEFESNDSISSRGSLILMKDNPSGLPENDDVLEVNILF